MVPLKYLSNIWRTIEMLLMNCEIILILAWSVTCVIRSSHIDQATAFAIIDTKLHFPVVTLVTLGLSAAAAADARIH